MGESTQTVDRFTQRDKRSFSMGTDLVLGKEGLG
jgi:hypothetical protein